MAINLRIEALNYSDQQEPCFSITVLPAEPDQNQPAPTMPDPIQESFCFFCLRKRPPDGPFYGYNIENSPVLSETMEEIFGPKFKLKKFSICTPCWKMVQLLDDFRTCCFEANSRVDRIKRGINGDEDDGWFTEETINRIDAMHSTIRDQIELIKAFEEIPEVSTDNDVITIDDDSDDDSIHDLIIDEQAGKRDHSEDSIEMISQSEHQSVLPERTEDVIEVIQSSTILHCPEQTIEMLPEVEHQSTIVDEFQPTHDLTEDKEISKGDKCSSKNVEQCQEQQQTAQLHQAGDVIVCSTPHSSFNIKIIPEEPDHNPMHLVLEDPAYNVVSKNAIEESKLPEISIHDIKTEVMLPEDSMDTDQITSQDQLNYPETCNFNIEIEPAELNNNPLHLKYIVPEHATEGTKLPDIFIPKIKTEVMLPEESMETDQAMPEEQLNLPDNLISEISVENVKVENEGVGEKIAKLVSVRVSQCGRCGKSFGPKAVQQHMQKCRHQDATAGTVLDDGNAMMYTCQICWASYRSRTNFTAHINQHAGYKQYRCRLMCKKQFFGLKGRQVHESKCNAYIGCAVCERPFTDKESLFAHIKEVHGKIAFKCEICGSSFKERRRLRVHNKKMHKEKDGGYCCRRCRNHWAKTAYEANLHLRECNVSFKCDRCDAELPNRTLLKAHWRRHNERFYPCNLCARKFKKKSSALQHQASHAESTFKCMNCPKTFDSLKNLKIHLSMHYTGQPFQCPSCPKILHSKQTLINHLKNNACLKRSQDAHSESQADEV